jgi:hypothetical protein
MRPRTPQSFEELNDRNYTLLNLGEVKDQEASKNFFNGVFNRSKAKEYNLKNSF